MEIRIENLSFSYQAVTDAPEQSGKKETNILQDFSMVIPQGGRVCIMGSSGAGKSTLLHILAGVLKPQGGSISGIDYERISMVFQEDRLIENQSALANVKIGLLRGVYPSSFENRIEQKEDKAESVRELICAHLMKVGLGDALQKPAAQLSGGMRRRVAIVRAMLSDSDLVLLDEPFEGLDADTRAKLLRYVSEQLGDRTLVLVTHEEEDARALDCEVVSILNSYNNFNKK